MIQSRLLRVALLGTVLTAMCTIGASAATLGAGTVTADALRLRSTPATEGEILATVSSGTSVVVLDEAEDGWYKVTYNSVEGYMSGEYLDVATKAETELGYGKVDADGSTLNMRAGASTSFDSLCSIPSGTVLELEGVYEGWYKVTYAGNTGYISSDYITITTEPTTASSSALGEQIVALAKQYLGTPYVLGGNGPSSFDCSPSSATPSTAPPPTSSRTASPSAGTSCSPATWSFSGTAPASRSPTWASTSGAASSSTPPPTATWSRSTR